MKKKKGFFKKIGEFFLYHFLKFSLSLRYKVTVKGLENLNSDTLKKPGGVLFLPNHTAMFIDPALVTIGVWKKFPIRPMITEKHYFIPVAHQIMKFLDGLPVPDFEAKQTEESKKRGEETFQTLMEGLRNQENFLIYPSGRLKDSCQEVVGGASGAHRIIQEVAEANIVLVRTKGLWGSSFSRAFTGKTPPLFPTVWHGIRAGLKNLIFFTPRRKVTIELTPAPDDFPYGASRLEMNRYLEDFYNKPDGLTEQVGKYPGDSLMLVSYSMWGDDYLKIPVKGLAEKVEVKIEENEISQDVKKKVFEKLASMSDVKEEDIKLEMDLSRDLGLDSLDIGELVSFLQDNFNTPSVPVTEMTTVKKMLGIATGQIKIQEEDEGRLETPAWSKGAQRFRAQLAHGDTMAEVFLNNCDRMKKAIACSDSRAGILKYNTLKLRILVLAEYIRHLEGEYIGIMLPASVAASATILACQIAGKVPLMVNWTVGTRHLASVVELSKVKHILTSKAFVERLEKQDLTPIEGLMIMLEDVRDKFSIVDKLRALIRSKRNAKSILKIFNVENRSKDDKAVLLFTSGTEAAPKGVPLTQENILSNQRAAFEAIDIYSDDVIFGFLPPFHSFGFTITSLMGLLAGVKTSFYPDPTDGKNVAKEFKKWAITIVCGAPTFLKSMLKAAKEGDLDTMRICVSGAEKAPEELVQLLSKIGKEQCLIEGYGITECSPVLTANRTGKPRKGVGQPIPGVELLIVDRETSEPVPAGTQGLILARGPGVFSGYINPGLASPFVTVKNKRWYDTGDLGFLDDEGRLTISGRLKRFIKIGPEMVSLPAVEDALYQAVEKMGWPSHDGPSIAICGKEEEDKKPIIVMFATFDTTPEEVNQTLKDAGFSNLIKVSQVIKVDEIPVMGTGKTHYRLLEEEYLRKPVV